jgi:AraC-like DNA-binding protein
MDPRILSLIAYMKDDLTRDSSLVELAEVVNLSSSYLRHAFKATTGLTPTQYLHRLRMQHARLLLESTFLRVKEVRLRIGIKSDSQFVRDFKRAYGLSPSRYRGAHGYPHPGPVISFRGESHIRQ